MKLWRQRRLERHSWTQIKNYFWRHHSQLSWAAIICWQSEEKLVLEEIIFDEEGRPKLGYSLTIFESLGFNLVKGETIVPSSNVKHICKLEKIERFSDVSNILAYLRSNLSPEDNQTHQLKMCISKLSKIIEAENQESDNCKKLLFLRDQLALINKAPKRYSSSFIWQALTWLKHPHRCIPCSKMMAFWHCQALVTWNRFLVRFPLKLDCPPEFVHT